MRRMMMLALCVAWPFALLSDTNGGGVGVQTIKVSSVSPLLTLKFWDYDAEDGDWVRIDVNGEKYREFELMHTPKTVSIPILFSDSDEVFVNVVGTQSGSGPVTYAVQATGLGSSTEVYKNSANVGLGNSYRIIKTKDDIFSVGIGYVTGLLGTNEKENYRASSFWNAESIPDAGGAVKNAVENMALDQFCDHYLFEVADSTAQTAILSNGGSIEKAELWGKRAKNVVKMYDLGKFTSEFLTDGLLLGNWEQAARDTETFVLDWVGRPWYTLGVWNGELIFNLTH